MSERNLTVVLAAATAFAVAVATVVVVSWARPAAGADGGTSAVGEPPLLPASAIIEDSVPGGLAMQISVVLRSRDPQGLAAMARRVSTPGSPDYRQFLKPGQFAGRFGASATTVAAVRRALTGLGLHPGPAAPNGLSIPVPATAAAAESAFGVRLRHVRLASGRVAFADDVAPRLPSTIASAISGLVGLDDIAQMHPHWQTAPGGDLAAAARTSPPAPATTAGPQPCAAATNAATATGGRTADQLAHAYNFGDLYSTNTSGSGVTVAVFELAAYAASDVAAFQSCYGSSAQVSNTPVDGGARTFDLGALEVELDIEGVISMAPQAKVAVYTGPNNTTGVLDTLSRIVSDDTAQVVSDSWGLCEAGVTSDFVNQESAIFQQAAVQGQTLLAAAGDSGSADCSHSLGVSVLAVDDPASQPFITGVGGTTLSAVSPTPSETVWNQTQHLGAGGGGISSRWPMPAEQQGPGVVNAWSTGTTCGASTGTDCREVPDVSASADPTHGYIIYYAGAESGISGWQSIGGTSAAAPLWAAAVALADQSCSCSIGFLNPALYNLAAAGPGSFTDITSGNNDYGGANGGAYPATPGYDMASGLGTPMVATLAAQLGRPAPATFTADTPPATVDLNRSFSYTFAALGHPSPTFSIATGALPSGVTLNPVTGVLSGTPTLAGTFSFVVAATNGIGVAAQSSAITMVVAPYVAPIITSAAATTFTVDYLGNFTGPARVFTVTATGNPPPRISATGLFGGLTWDDHGDGTAKLGSINQGGSGGTFRLTITASNGTGTNAVQAFTVVLDQQVGLNFTAQPPAGNIDRSYRYAFAIGGYPVPTASVPTGSLPPGLTLSAAGVLAGRPTAAGSFTFTIAVDNGTGAPQSTRVTMAISPPAVAGTIMNFAGDPLGYAGSNSGGDGGPATSAKLRYPSSVAIDGAGSVYITDTNPQIREVDNAGIIKNFAGNPSVRGNTGDGGPALAATFTYPWGLAFDRAGNLYITDVSTKRVRRVDGAGIVTNFAGNSAGTAGNSGDGGPATAATFQHPSHVAVDGAGNVYVTDDAENRVRKISPSGIIINSAGSPAGTHGNSGDGGLATAATLYNPGGVAIDAAGNVYIADSGNNRVRKVDRSGTISNFAGQASGQPMYYGAGDGGPATSAGLASPTGVAFDSAGNLYITDTLNYRVRKVDTTSTITNFAGGGFAIGDDGDTGPATNAGFAYPYEVAANAASDVFIADFESDRVRVVYGAAPSPAAFTGATPPPSAIVGSTYRYAFTAIGHPAPAFYEVQGTIPPGLNLDAATGLLTGTATTAGIYNFTVAADNGFGRPALSSLLSITVSASDAAPVLSGAGDVIFTVASPGTRTIMATGNPTPTLRETGVLPAGVSFVDNQNGTATLAGTAVGGSGGQYQVSITANNEVGSPATQVFILTVNQAPVITSTANATFIVGVAGTFSVSKSGFPLPNLTATGTLPAGVSFNSTSGTLAGTPGQQSAAAYPITVTATNGVGTPAMQSFVIVVDQARFVYPTAGKSSIDTTRPIRWSTIRQAQAYIVVIGTADYKADLVNSGILPPTTSSYRIGALPTGTKLYATLLAEINGAWNSFEAITFTAAPGLGTLTFPVNNQSAIDPSRAFTWSTIPQAQGYILVVGTTAYGSNLVSSGVLRATQSSYPIPLFPTGQKLYATLLTEVNGAWTRFQAITFSAGPPTAGFTWPHDGQSQVATPTAVTWTAIAGATNYQLVVGTSPFGTDLVNSGLLPAGQTAFNVAKLPAGETLYATVLTQFQGRWTYQAVTFTAR